MWWIIAWAVLALIAWAAFVLLALSTPSTERVTNSDVAGIAIASIVCSGIIIAIAYGIASGIRGIF